MDLTMKNLSRAIAVIAGASTLSLSNAALAVTLEEVVVTATRSEASLLDVPVAVSAFGAEELKTQGAHDVQDLTLVDPSLFGTEQADPIGGSPIRIRGVGTNSGNAGFESAVGFYVDDVYRSRGGAAMTTFFDMAGVEVLRGPQGTLFGKNTSAGAITQRTNPAVLDETSGSVSVDVGNYGYQNYQGYYNAPISETVAFRISGVYTEEDGFFEDSVTGDDDVAAQDTQAVRAQIAFEPTDRLSGRFIADYSEFNGGTRRSAAKLGTIIGTPFSRDLALDTASGGTGTWPWEVDGTGNPVNFVDPFEREYFGDATQEINHLQQWGGTLHLNYDFDDVTVRSITGYRDLDNTNGGDGDWTGAALNGGQEDAYSIQSFSQEFLINGVTENGSWVAGINYFKEDIDYRLVANIGEQLDEFFAIAFGIAPDVPTAVATTPFLPGFSNPVPLWDSTFEQEEESIGVFGQYTWDITEQLALIAGARYNSVEKDATHDQAIAVGDTLEEQLLSIANYTAANFAAFPLASPQTQPSPDWEESIKDEELTYEVTLQWRPTEEIQLWGKYAYGFKAGGMSFDPTTAGAQWLGDVAPGDTPIVLPGTLTTVLGDLPLVFTPFNEEGTNFAPETVDSYELGFRWEYMDGRGRLQAVAFYSVFEDLQVGAFNGFAFQVNNAGESTTQGLELENTFQVNDFLTLNVSGTILDASYDSATADDIANGIDQAITLGRDRSHSPDFAGTIGVRYDQPLDNGMGVFANANYAYFGEMFLSDSAAQSDLKQSDYSVFGASLGLRSEDDTWNVSIYCENCFDEEYLVYGFTHTFQNGDPMVNVGAPAQYGLRAGYNFY